MKAEHVSEPVLKYLARYLSGGPISDGRIVSTDDTNVTLTARAGEVTGGERKQVPVTLTQVEFVRRWCLHVLPRGYTRTRRIGGWANTKREAYLELLAKLLDAAGAPLSDQATEFGPFDDSADDLSADSTEDTNGGASAERLCKGCGCWLIPHSMTEKPSWSRVMDSSHLPRCYQRH